MKRNSALVKMMREYLADLPTDDGEDIYADYREHAWLQFAYFLHWIEHGELLQNVEYGVKVDRDDVT